MSLAQTGMLLEVSLTHNMLALAWAFATVRRRDRRRPAVEHAVEAAIAQGYRTPDIATPEDTPVTTQQLGAAIVQGVSETSG